MGYGNSNYEEERLFVGIILAIALTHENENDVTGDENISWMKS
jgi:hypothetical protein